MWIVCVYLCGAFMGFEDKNLRRLWAVSAIMCGWREREKPESSCYVRKIIESLTIF